MKKICCLLLFIAFSARAQNDAEVAIRQLLQAQADAWNRGNLEDYMKAGYHHDDSLLFLGKSGATFGFDSTLARYRRSYRNATDMGQLRFEVLRIMPLSRKAAYAAGRWHLLRPAGPVSGAFLLVLRKTRNGWRIVADHSS